MYFYSITFFVVDDDLAGELVDFNLLDKELRDCRAVQVDDGADTQSGQMTAGADGSGSFGMVTA